MIKYSINNIISEINNCPICNDPLKLYVSADINNSVGVQKIHFQNLGKDIKLRIKIPKDFDSQNLIELVCDVNLSNDTIQMNSSPVPYYDGNNIHFLVGKTCPKQHYEIYFNNIDGLFIKSFYASPMTLFETCNVMFNNEIIRIFSDNYNNYTHVMFNKLQEVEKEAILSMTLPFRSLSSIVGVSPTEETLFKRIKSLAVLL